MTEHEHCQPILRTTARRLIAGKIVVTVRGAEHVIPAEEADDLRDALDRALDGVLGGTGRGPGEWTPAPVACADQRGFSCVLRTTQDWGG